MYEVQTEFVFVFFLMVAAMAQGRESGVCVGPRISRHPSKYRAPLASPLTHSHPSLLPTGILVSVSDQELSNEFETGQ